MLRIHASAEGVVDPNREDPICKEATGMCLYESEHAKPVPKQEKLLQWETCAAARE